MTHHLTSPPLRGLQSVPVLALLLALVLVAIAPATAFAGSFDNRKSELLDQLDDIPAADITPKEKKQIKEALDDYFDHRERILDALLDLVAETDTDEVQPDWAGPVASLQNELNSTMSVKDALSGIDTPTLAALAFCQKTVAAETAWISALGGLHVAAARDTIVRTCNHLAEANEDLQDKWEELKEQDDRLDEMEQSAAKEMRELLEEAVEKAIKEHRTFKEKLASMPGKLKPFRQVGGQVVSKLPDGAIKVILDATFKIGEALENGTEIWLVTNREAIRRTALIDGVVRSEQSSIVRLFDTTREQTRSFVEQYGPVVARSAYKAAEDELDDFAGIGTDGQQDDAEAFADAAIKLLGSDYSDHQEAMEVFEDAHTGRWLDDVSDETIEALAEPDYWENERERIERIAEKVEDELEEWRADVKNLESGSLSEFTKLEKERIRKELKSRINELISIMNRALQMLAADNLTECMERDDIEDDFGG